MVLSPAATWRRSALRPARMRNASGIAWRLF